MSKWKKKYALTWFLTLVGTAIAFMTGAGLGEWAAFTTLILATFSAADVADKKLNGGNYNGGRGNNPTG